MNLWRHEESNVGQKDDTHLNSSVNTEEPINLLDEEPDVIMINEETLKDDDCSRKSKSSSLRDDQVHQTQAEEQPLDGMISTQGDSTTWSDLSPDVGFIPYNLNFNETVTPKKKFKCVFCGKTFEYLSHMTKHMRKHSGEKPYVCTVCGKRFAQKTYLTTHERTHSGERPYACMECGKSFSQKSSLNVHLRSHTGEKPYSCSHCGKSYAFKIALKSHRC
ncbi:zinc finger protein 2 homolog isoform X2 [Sinocyclocheilus grahami]|uniref:zinc finger protein 2 homolog isoform X2 n=1 Tax=Sinocyclocheilus grahami TaxID=75366 RepID=UPI0007ACD253|nr:PREDICTED: zinc finger protein 2 homolog isoform X2 [Sinocyclocheilus grahami]